MAAEASSLGLEGLPALLAGLARATVQAGAAVVRDSLPTTADSTLAADHYYAIAATGLQFRFLVTRQATQVVLFFRKRQSEQRPLAATIDLKLAPSDSSAGEPASLAAASIGAAGGARPGAPQVRLRLPSFIDLSPTPDEQVRYAPSGADADSLVLFRIGPRGEHRLAIALGDDLDDSEVVYFDGVRQVLGETWPARPLVDLAAEIRDWLAEQQAASGPLPSEHRVELDLADADNDAVRLIQTVIAAYGETESALPPPSAAAGSLAALLADPRSDASLTQAGLLPGYAIADYRAEVQLRLGPDGLISSEGEAVSLAMGLTVARRASGLAVEIALLPPDFLITGTLHSQFVEALRSLTPGRQLPPDLVAPGAWSDLITAAQASLSIFRVDRRGEVDEELVVLPTTPRSGRERVLLFSLQAVIDRTTPVPRVSLSDLRLRFDSQSDEDGAVDRATARYFLRLAQSLHTWIVWTGRDQDGI